jgi:hypothetical protein
MSERVEVRYSSEIEEALGTLFSAPEPDPAFVARLERQLMAQDRAGATEAAEEAPPLRRFWDLIWQPVRRHRWATVGIAVLLAVAVAFLAVGPQRVWADLQRLLGYVPGVGFVNLEETRVLTAPMTVTRDGVTLRVEQVLAQPDGTTVVISSEGLPPEDEVVDRSRDPRAMSLAGIEIRLPDGTRLSPNTLASGWGAARLGFPPLPEGLYHLTLEVERLPRVPVGVAPEDWEIPVTLRPATGELIGELFPEAYVPAEASETHADVTLRVVAAVHTPEVTALRVRVEWPSPAWQGPRLHRDYQGAPGLHDDVGHIYRHVRTQPVSGTGFTEEVAVEKLPPPGHRDIPPLPASGVLTEEQTLTLAPISPSAQRLTLPIDEVSFVVPVEETFTLDLGENSQPGDSWVLDEHLTVAGSPIRVTGVQLEKADPGGMDFKYQLTFDVEREEVGNPTLSGIVVEVPFRGRGGGMTSGSFIGDENAKPSAVGEALPLHPFTVTVRRVWVSVRGPWTLSWPVPGAEEKDAPVSPLTLRPEDVGQARGPLSLTIDGATLTDRLTAVHLAAGPLPPGAEVRFPSGSGETAPYLEDDRGRRYELEEDVGWEPEEETVERSGIPHTLAFEPLQPLARRVTLRVPEAELILPDEASFDVTVPAGIELEPRFEVTMEPVFPDSPRSKVWSSSDPWDVDVTLEAAGYRVQLTQARLEQFGGTTQLALTSEGLRPRPGGYRLTDLGIASATGPSGEDLRLAGGLDLRGFFEERFPPETRHRAVLTFGDLENEPVPPGRYHVEVDEFWVLVEGPWGLSWELPGP